MGYYMKSALDVAVDGLSAFMSCFRPAREDPMIRPESVDRYFARVGGYLVHARDRFERECMGASDNVRS